MAKVLIIGGVAGGATCAARLRRLDESAEIIILERGDYISYANCGLPYHVGGVIEDREDLLLQTPLSMKERYNIEVRVRNEAIAIDRANKKVRVRLADTGETYEESYDTLVISTGSSPLRPPIPGIDSPRIQSLWTVPDTDRIIAHIREHGVKTAAVIGGGFIGLEMAENLHALGISVSLVEMLDQVMAPLDFEMAQLLHENIAANGVSLHLGDGVSSFAETEKDVEISLKSGVKLSAELVILAIGVRPNSEIAKAAGLEMNARGGIIVDEYLRTADPDIYAVGDVIEVEDFIFKDPAMVPLAGPANKQGRIAANNIAGAKERYEGTMGTAVAKVFDLTAASTGANEKSLLKRGLEKGRDFETVTIVQNSHAGYYPGAMPMTLKLLFSADGKKIFGAQIVGAAGVDKRIDVLATAIRLGADIEDLKSLELAYAPPYSSAKDPVNMLGFVAGNLIAGKTVLAPWDVAEKEKEARFLDVREPAEFRAFPLPGAKNIPLGQLRSRLNELDREAEIVVFCAVGVRAHNAGRLLHNMGFQKVRVYPGGMWLYRAVHYKSLPPGKTEMRISDSGFAEA